MLRQWAGRRGARNTTATRNSPGRKAAQGGDIDAFFGLSLYQPHKKRKRTQQRLYAVHHKAYGAWAQQPLECASPSFLENTTQQITLCTQSQQTVAQLTTRTDPNNHSDIGSPLQFNHIPWYAKSQESTSKCCTSLVQHSKQQ